MARSVNQELLRDAAPLIAARAQDGPLTIDALQGVFDETVERYNLNLFSIGGQQRERCISLLAELCGSFGTDRHWFDQHYAQIDPDSPAGLTPAALMGVAASNLDRWLGTADGAVPPEALADFERLLPTFLKDDWATADAIVTHARQQALVPNLVALHGLAAGEDLMITLFAVVSLLSGTWSAKTDEYHDDLLRRVLA